MHNSRPRKLAALACLLLLAAPAALAQDFTAGAPDSASVSRRLSSRLASERRGAAEELARLAAVEHRRLVEGYRVQEKDDAVKNALDWALYRMGKSESLFPLVRSLDSKKHAGQAVGYLKQLDEPRPLYVFLDRVNGNTQIRLLEGAAGGLVFRRMILLQSRQQFADVLRRHDL